MLVRETAEIREIAVAGEVEGHGHPRDVRQQRPPKVPAEVTVLLVYEVGGRTKVVVVVVVVDREAVRGRDPTWMMGILILHHGNEAKANPDVGVEMGLLPTCYDGAIQMTGANPKLPAVVGRIACLLYTSPSPRD